MNAYVEPIYSNRLKSENTFRLRDYHIVAVTRNIFNQYVGENVKAHKKQELLSGDYSFFGFEGTYLTEEKQRNLKKLKEIEKLQYNWNENNALPFNKKLIDECREILDLLLLQPEIFPTAAESIQMEYEKSNGEYLEFNIFLDRIEVFQIDEEKQEYESELDLSEKNQMQQIVRLFYG